MIGRMRVVVIGALLVGLVCVPAASAKVYFSGVPETAAPGTVVNAYVAGCEARRLRPLRPRGVGFRRARRGWPTRLQRPSKAAVVGRESHLEREARLQAAEGA